MSLSIRQRSLLIPVVLAVLVGFSLVSSAGAFAAPGYIPLTSFLFPESQGSAEPGGLAVDNSTGLDADKGDVYVTNEINDIVDEFSAQGAFISQVSVPGVHLGQLTVDDYAGPHEGYVYVAGPGNGVIYAFSPGLGSTEELITGLSKPTDVTVDEAGDVFVSEEEGRVLEFNETGKPIKSDGAVVGIGENAVVEGFSEQMAVLAINANGTELYVASPDALTVKYVLTNEKYIANQAPLTKPEDPTVTSEEPIDAPYELSGKVGTVNGLTVSRSNDVYIAEWVVTKGQFSPLRPPYVLENDYRVAVYEPNGNMITNFGSGILSTAVAGVGINEESGEAYIADLATTGVVHYPAHVSVFTVGERPVAPVTESYSQSDGTVVFNGSLAGGQTTYRFAYNKGSSCQGEGSQTTVAVAASGAQPVHAEVSNLARSTQYSFCLVAMNTYGATFGSPLSFETGEVAPNIANVSVSIGVEAGTLSAQINPEGVASSYYVEYGPNVAYGSKTQETPVGSGEKFTGVSTTLIGLEPSKLYHYRVVAMSSAGVRYGPDETVTTYAAASGLPDGRVYEMVTPPENEDANVHGPGPAPVGIFGTGEPFESSENGNSVAYVADPSANGGNGKTGNTTGNQYLAFRSPQGGWKQVNVDPPGDATVKYEAFLSDLSMGIFRSDERDAGGYRGIYSLNSANESISSISNVAAPYRHGHGLVGEELQDFEPFYAGASSDLSHMLVEANDDLLPDHGTPIESELNNDVKAEVDQITLLDEEWIKLSYEYQELSKREGQSGSGTEAKGVEVKAKQEEIEALQGTDDHPELYVSVGGSLSLVNVSPEGTVVQGATFGGPKSTRSHVISTDGSRIFWSSVTEIPLDYEPGAGGKNVRLRPKAVYVREGGVRTVQVSAGPAQFWTASPDGRFAFYIETGKLWRFDVENETRRELAGASEGVQAVVAVNETGEDGAYVYYVATEALAGVENDARQVPVEGSDNLYLQEPDPEHPGQRKTVFIATLASEEDNNDWSGNIAVRQARATPSGETLAFMANENLTNSSYPREGAPEAYVFDAQDDSLICASCRAQASGGELPADNNALLLPQWISENGDRVFFDSEAPLVWHDINGTMDVYEWERAGSGECREEAGCVYLISGGREGPAEFVGASVSGNDVFFVTRQRLSPQDGNENVDLYDARVGGVEAVSPPVCEGTACQGIPSPPPVFATPASVTFSGVGNFTSTVAPKSVVKTKARALTRKQKLTRALKQCRKQRAKGMRAACEGRARKRYETKTMGSGKSASKREGK